MIKIIGLFLLTMGLFGIGYFMGRCERRRDDE